MSTTTIGIEDTLKARIGAAAGRAGNAPRAVLLEAIQQNPERAELDDDLHRDAEARSAKLLASGKTVSWDDAETVLQTREKRESARGPTPRTPVR